jgi:hypothetical protein
MLFQQQEEIIEKIPIGFERNGSVFYEFCVGFETPPQFLPQQYLSNLSSYFCIVFALDGFGILFWETICRNRYIIAIDLYDCG